jgi:hypothetical protein
LRENFIKVRGNCGVSANKAKKTLKTAGFMFGTLFAKSLSVD